MQLITLYRSCRCLITAIVRLELNNYFRPNSKGKLVKKTLVLIKENLICSKMGINLSVRTVFNVKGFVVFYVFTFKVRNVPIVDQRVMQHPNNKFLMHHLIYKPRIVFKGLH